jgi:hypothetical protein
VRRFFRKLLGRDKAGPSAEQPRAITLDDITAWMAGEADEATRAAIARELDDPDSRTSRYLAWQADPRKHERQGGESPPSRPLPGEKSGPGRHIRPDDTDSPGRSR